MLRRIRVLKTPQQGNSTEWVSQAATIPLYQGYGTRLATWTPSFSWLTRQKCTGSNSTMTWEGSFQTVLGRRYDQVTNRLGGAALVHSCMQTSRPAHLSAAPSCCPQAEELYTTSDQQGPCLLLLRGVTAAPAALNKWLSEVGLVWACTRIYWLGSHAASSRQQLVEQLLAQGPPPGPIRLQCFPRSMETWLAVSDCPCPPLSI